MRPAAAPCCRPARLKAAVFRRIDQVVYLFLGRHPVQVKHRVVTCMQVLSAIATDFEECVHCDSRSPTLKVG